MALPKKKKEGQPTPLKVGQTATAEQPVKQPEPRGGGVSISDIREMRAAEAKRAGSLLKPSIIGGIDKTVETGKATAIRQALEIQDIQQTAEQQVTKPLEEAKAAEQRAVSQEKLNQILATPTKAPETPLNSQELEIQKLEAQGIDPGLMGAGGTAQAITGTDLGLLASGGVAAGAFGPAAILGLKGSIMGSSTAAVSATGILSKSVAAKWIIGAGTFLIAQVPENNMKQSEQVLSSIDADSRSLVDAVKAGGDPSIALGEIERLNQMIAEQERSIQFWNTLNYKALVNKGRMIELETKLRTSRRNLGLASTDILKYGSGINPNDVSFTPQIQSEMQKRGITQ